MGNQQAIRGFRTSIGPAGREWRLLQVRPRREKPVAQSLDARGITRYVPCERRDRVYAGVALNIELPRFPGVVFVCGTPEEIREATRCDGALGLVPPDSPSLAEGDLSEALRTLNDIERCGATLPGSADLPGAMAFAETSTVS